MAFWKRIRRSCQWAALPGRGDDGNDAQLLPELGDGAQNAHLRDSLAKRLLEFGDIRLSVALKALVKLDGERRNRARAGKLRRPAPVAIAAQGIDIWEHPGRDYVIRLLAGSSQKVEAYRDALLFEPDQQILGMSDLFLIGSAVALAGYRFYKARGQRSGELALGEKQAQTSLFHPCTRILQCQGPVSVLAHPFGARCFQLLRCQRRTSFPGPRNGTRFVMRRFDWPVQGRPTSVF